MSVSSRSGARGFSISVHNKITYALIFGAPAPAPLMREIDICARGLLCTKLNSEQLLFEPFFNVMCIFVSVEPQSTDHAKEFRQELHAV